jgi:hypothetical protein
MLDSVLLEPLIVLFVKATELLLVTIAVAPANKFNSVGVAVSVIDEPLPNAVYISLKLSLTIIAPERRFVPVPSFATAPILIVCLAID